MKRILFKLVIVAVVITSALASCNKNDSLPTHPTTGPSLQFPMSLNLTGYLEQKAGGMQVAQLRNVIPPLSADHSVKIYVVTNGGETQINQPISFMGGVLWATNTLTDVGVNYRGPEILHYLNIKIVIE